MEVYLDARRLDEVSLDGRNLEELLGEIMTAHLAEDRAITEVRVNGATYSEETPGTATSVARGEIGRLDVITAPTTHLAQVLLNTGPDHLETMTEAARKVAEEFRIGDEAEANEQYLLFLQALQDFFAFLGCSLEAVSVPLAHLEIDGLSAPSKIRELTRLLTEMVDRQQEQDWILLADLLEYELAPLLEDWRTLLIQVKKVAN